MKMIPLGHVLTKDGVLRVAEFANGLAAGSHDNKHYLDVHRDLREAISPHVKQPGKGQVVDIDYLTLVILNALRAKGVPVPGSTVLPRP